MIKELKYLFFLIIIFFCIFFTLKFYFSDIHKKKLYRSLKFNNEKILSYSQKLVILGDNTNNIVEYLEKTKDKNKKNYNFWKLINNDE
jgi:Na+/phosphate symporter